MKRVVGLVSLLLVGAMVAGCQIQPEQIKVIAQNAGLFSAVGWIAVDNPTSDEIKAVTGILKVIDEKSADVQAGATYTEVVYPEVVKFIDSDQVQPQYHPIAKAAALSLLGGLDMLFATHPEWKTDQDTVIQVVDAFVFGAKNGLSLSEDDEVMQAARNSARRKARVLR